MAEPDHITLESGGKIILEGDTDHLILETSDTGTHPSGSGSGLSKLFRRTARDEE